MSNVFALLHLRKFYFGSLLGSFLVLLPLGAYAATSNSATLQWAANTESDLAGYKVYHGTSPGIYGTSLDAGNMTSYQYLNLDPNKSHYFTVTAYDTSGNESLPSPEVSKTIIVTTPPVSDQKTGSVSNQGIGSVGSALSSVSYVTAPVSPLLLADDFNDGDFLGWQVVNEGTWEAPSAWAVVGGALQQTSNIYDGNTDGTVLPKKGTFAWYTAGQSWSNYQVGVELRSTDDDAVGVMVRYQDPGNYYRFSWDAQRKYRRLVKVVNGQVTLLRQDTVPYVPNQKYQVEVLAQGTTLEVRVDGVPLFGGPVVDSALARGSVALYSWGNTGSVFENVQVSVVPVSPLLLADDFNDGDFLGWQVVNEGTWEAPSAWAVVGGALQQTSNIYDGNTDGTVLPKKGTFAWYTAGQSWSNYQVGVELRSTDDDAVGVMVRYQDPGNYYRFSWDAQRKYRRLVKVVNGQVTLLRQDTVPYVPNQKYQVEVLAQGTTLEVRVDGVPLFGGPVVDSALARGSVALYSWGNTGSVFENVQVSVVPVSPLLLADDFNDGDFLGWQVVNEGTWEAPSAWAVVGGALQQTSNIYDGNTDGTVLPKKGTFAWYTAGQSWSNYQVGVELRSTDDDAVGVMVRYQDPGNYYRFSWDAQRKYRRLVKVVNGQVTLLRQDTVPYVPNQKYQVEVLAQGTTLEVRVDGVPLFGGPVVDSALARGSVALYSWGNTGSVFENVQVSVVPVSNSL